MPGPARSLRLGLIDDLSKEHRAKVSTKSHPTGNVREPYLSRTAQRIWKEYRCLEAPAYLLRYAEKRVFGDEGDDLIDLRNQLPESFELGWRKNGRSGRPGGRA